MVYLTHHRNFKTVNKINTPIYAESLRLSTQNQCNMDYKVLYLKMANTPSIPFTVFHTNFKTNRQTMVILMQPQLLQRRGTIKLPELSFFAKLLWTFSHSSVRKSKSNFLCRTKQPLTENMSVEFEYN